MPRSLTKAGRSRRGALWAALFLLSACGSSTPPENRGLLLHSIAHGLVLPAYRELARSTQQLAERASRLAQDPSHDTLAAAQEAWRTARGVWKRSEVFRFGPAEDLNVRFASKIDFSPIRPQSIEDEIAGSHDLDAAYIDTIGTNRRGFLALEYLLFDDAGGNAVLTALSGAEGARRRAYVVAVAEDLAVQSARLRDAWEPKRGNYAGAFTRSGAGGGAFPTEQEALSEVVGAMVRLSVTIEDKKLGEPAGLTTTMTTPRPELVETVRSHHALRDIIDSLKGIGEVYYCPTPRGRCFLSMFDTVALTTPQIDGELRVSLGNALLSIEEIPLPLELAVVETPDAVALAYHSLRRLRLALSVGLVSALQAIPRFSADGD